MGRLPKHPHYVTNRIRVFRAVHRWSQTEVARKLGYESKFHLWQLENELIFPTPDERRKLAKIFGVSERLLFPRKAA
jgi:transcriptional regulator with XRE-family HTH domain